MNEKIEQFGSVISIRNRKSECEKTQKESMVCFAIEPETKRAVTDIKYNYLQERWDVKIYQRKKQIYTEASTLKKGTGNNITENPPRIEQNISDNKITQSDEGKNSLAQDKKCYACNQQNSRTSNSRILN